MNQCALTHHPLDTVSSNERIIVFPDDHNLPSCGPQEAFGIRVALDVASELRSPPSAVRLGQRPVRRAGMPIAASDLDNDTGTSEHDVVASARPGDNRSVQSVTQTASV
jgi:hypothetical protein